MQGGIAYLLGLELPVMAYSKERKASGGGMACLDPIPRKEWWLVDHPIWLRGKDH
jgi:hypothetical protein